MARVGIQIGRVSAQTGLSADAIRFYEREGLLESVSRTEGGFRLFTAGDVRRLEFILQAQKLGFSLSEIRELLILQRGEGEACCHVRDLLRTKLAGVRAKLRELGSLEQQLTKSLRKCERKLKAGETLHHDSCPMLEGIARRGSDDN
jgi:DNA-binding transcriptional MerR regulator